MSNIWPHVAKARGEENVIYVAKYVLVSRKHVLVGHGHHRCANYDAMD